MSQTTINNNGDVYIVLVKWYRYTYDFGWTKLRQRLHESGYHKFLDQYGDRSDHLLLKSSSWCDFEKIRSMEEYNLDHLRFSKVFIDEIKKSNKKAKRYRVATWNLPYYGYFEPHDDTPVFEIHKIPADIWKAGAWSIKFTNSRCYNHSGIAEETLLIHNKILLDMNRYNKMKEQQNKILETLQQIIYNNHQKSPDILKVLQDFIPKDMNPYSNGVFDILINNIPYLPAFGQEYKEAQHDFHKKQKLSYTSNLS